MHFVKGVHFLALNSVKNNALNNKMKNMYTLKEKVKAKGLKIGWLANQVGIPQTTLSSYLNGARTMPLSVEAKLKTLLK